MSRDITKATPYLQWFWQELQKAVKAELNLNIFLVDVDRDWKVQRAYYAQGRDRWAVVNSLREAASLPPITYSQNSKKITWTMKSKHITNLENEEQIDDRSRAIDIGLKDTDGRYVGNPSADINKDNEKDYEQIAKIAKRIGGSRIRCGIDFGDAPHYEEI
jgi:hypothetical protein